jgi:tetratricopeptide (TPR) repeat protein
LLERNLWLRLEPNCKGRFDEHRPFEVHRRKALRLGLTISATLSLPLNLGSAELPQLAYSRRLLAVTPQFLDKAETKIAPLRPTETKGIVLIIYWTSERGAVVSARALDGPPELQKAAAEAIYKWKFKPASVNGQPVQMGSAVMVDFSQVPAVVQVPKPMTAAQLSPGFQFKCFDGLVHDEPASVGVCQQQLEAVSRDSHSTPLDRFTADDQYGLVLMKYANDAEKALEQFSEAIELAPQRLDSTDAEWAYAYWHRATAEQELGDSAEAEKDFSVAENSLREAENTIGNEQIASYNRELVSRIAAQRAAH